MIKVALLVGVSEYKPGLELLPSAIEDVRAMERVLQHPEMGGFDEVKVLTNPMTHALRIAIYNLFAERSPEDLVLFYFSGHGVKDQNLNLYLTTPETTKSEKGLVVSPTAVDAIYLQKQMTNSRSEHEVIILDCCYSGAIAKGLTAKDEGEVNIIAELGGRGRAILTSSTSVQSSFQQEAALSIYTQYIVEGIETGAADLDNDGLISTDELHQYVTKKVQQASPAMTPQFYPVEEGYKIYLARSPQLASPQIDTPSLQVFEFDVVTVEVEVQRAGRFGLGSKVTLNSNRSHSQAQYFTEDLGNGVTLDMVYIPGGKFLMGTEDKEIERLVQRFHTDWDWFRNEKPQHEVTIQPFFMGKFPVTQAQWRAVANLPKVDRDLAPEPSRFKGDNLPVEKVSWYDAVEFCKRLSRETAREYRLPSEAEWEYACRAGTTTLFHFGETITSELANYNRKQTTDVGSFPPNAFGLYDMHGNVFEWCADAWRENYEGAPTDGSVWETNNNSSGRVMRGGCWYSLQKNCPCAFRDCCMPDTTSISIGFRVVL